jgi:hypothetical protein
MELIMEHRLLTPRTTVLKGEGIPYRLIQHLMQGTRTHGHTYSDGNLLAGSYQEADEDIAEINELERSLGSLSPEQMDMRVMADFCCIWRYDYPRRVHELCAAIGGSPHTAFGLHYQISAARRQELVDYAQALKQWLGAEQSSSLKGRSPEQEQTSQKVHGFLGDRDPLKDLLVERTYLGLSSRALNCSYWGYNARRSVSLAPYTAQELEPDWHKRMAALERAIQKEMGHCARDFLCDVGGTAEPACHFKFVRRVDILVSSIGCLRWRGNLPPKDKTISGRRSITSQYLAILEQYWRDNDTGTNAIEEENEQKVRDELFTLLGDRTAFKRWLVASLWKNIKNQTRFHAFPMKRWVEFVRTAEDYLNRR